MQRYKSTAWPLALLYAVLIVYASLYPFHGWRDQGLSPWAFVAAPLPRYWSRFDLLANAVGYVPLGGLLTVALQRVPRRGLAALLAALAGTLLSLLMEGLQSYLPQRVPSNVDWALNAAGAALGALLALGLERRGVIEGGRRLRARWFVRDSRGALLLLGLWPVGLLFPAPVALGQGQLYQRLLDALAELLQGTPLLALLPTYTSGLRPLSPALEALCVALGGLLPCLLGAVVLRDRARRLLFAVAALGVGAAASTLSAALTFGPQYAWAWLSQPVVLGLLMAAALALATTLVPRRGAALLLLMALLLQVWLLNLAPQSPYYAATLQSWEQGRFIHFHGLSQWVGWLWPYATLLYVLAWLGGVVGGRAGALQA